MDGSPPIGASPREQASRSASAPPPESSAWLNRRAVEAIVLSVTFYVLALGLAGLLFWIPVLLAEGGPGAHPAEPSLLILWLAAGAIVWSRLRVLPETDTTSHADPRQAIHLLRDLEALEAKLLEAIAPNPDAFRALRIVDWEAAAPPLLLDSCRRAMMKASVGLADLTAATGPTNPESLATLARRMPMARSSVATLDAAAEAGAKLVAVACTCNLVAAGWQLVVLPGHPVLRKGSGVVLWWRKTRSRGCPGVPIMSCDQGASHKALAHGIRPRAPRGRFLRTLATHTADKE
jgi:hypothetical protein